MSDEKAWNRFLILFFILAGLVLAWFGYVSLLSGVKFASLEPSHYFFAAAVLAVIVTIVTIINWLSCQSMDDLGWGIALAYLTSPMIIVSMAIVFAIPAIMWAFFHSR